jgi:hypothetical protein
MALLKQKWLSEINEFKDAKQHKVHVHTITLSDTLSDVEDPDLYIAEPIYKWQQTEKGKWVMDHSMPSPSFHRHIDHSIYGYRYFICAYLSSKDYTYYRLKFE